MAEITIRAGVSDSISNRHILACLESDMASGRRRQQAGGSKNLITGLLDEAWSTVKIRLVET